MLGSCSGSSRSPPSCGRSRAGWSSRPSTVATRRASAEVAGEAERLCAAIKLGFAKRAADTNGWRHRSQASSEAQWLAGVSGTTEFQARDTLKTAERLEELPATETRLREGSLSLTQAGLVAKAAEVAHGSFSGPTEEVAELLRALEPIERRRFAAARQDPDQPHEAYEARCFDALIDLARTDAPRSADEPPTPADQPVTRLRVDLARLLDHDPDGPGEVCEIPGVGPVPVDWARRVLPHGLLELVITDGVDVQTVVSRTRHVPEALKVAIFERDQRCKIHGCDATHGLERHHTLPFATHHLTTYDLLGMLCRDHHDQITHRGYEIVDHPDRTWTLRAPTEPQHRQPDAA